MYSKLFENVPVHGMGADGLHHIRVMLWSFSSRQLSRDSTFDGSAILSSLFTQLSDHQYTSYEVLMSTFFAVICCYQRPRTMHALFL